MPPTVQDFLASVAKLGLGSDEQLAACLQESAGLPPAKTSEEVAQRLVTRKVLTPFQAKQIYAGKGARLVLGNYLLVDKLGQGGMGTVYKAVHRRMERVVALKVLSAAGPQKSESVARFQREVKAAAQMSHPNIVTAFDADEINGAPFLVMEYVAGHDLSSVVRSKGPLTFSVSCNYVIQAAQGLAYAHERGIIHRDIKPANLLLDKSGTVKVLDMGLARLQLEAGAQTALTGSGQLMGTLDFMPPEQAVDTKQADHRADIYSLGMTWWYLLTGRPAYDGDSIVEKVLAHREQPIPSLLEACPGAPPAAETVFQRLVAKRPADRYQSMAEVIVALEACRQAVTTSAALGSRPVARGERTSDARSLPPTATFSASALNTAAPETISVTTSPSFQTITIKPDSMDRLPRQIFGVPRSVVFLVLSLIATCGLGVAAIVNWPSGEVAQNAKPSTTGKTTTAAAESTTQQPPKASGPFALRFDGQDDYVEFPMIPLQATDPVTIEAWVTPTGDYSNQPATPWIDGHIFGWEKFEDLCLAAYAEGLGAGLNVTPQPGDKGIAAIPLRRNGLNLGQRQHLALTVEGTRAAFFVDGKQAGSQTLPRSIGSRRTSPMMGAFIDGRGMLERAFEGLIDEVRLSRCVRYRSNFVPDEVFAVDAEAVAVYHFDEQDAKVLKDSTSNHYHGTITGARWEAR